MNFIAGNFHSNILHEPVRLDGPNPDTNGQASNSEPHEAGDRSGLAPRYKSDTAHTLRHCGRQAMFHALKSHAVPLSPLVVSAPIRGVPSPQLVLATTGARRPGLIGNLIAIHDAPRPSPYSAAGSALPTMDWACMTWGLAHARCGLRPCRARPRERHWP